MSMRTDWPAKLLMLADAVVAGRRYGGAEFLEHLPARARADDAHLKSALDALLRWASSTRSSASASEDGSVIAGD